MKIVIYAGAEYILWESGDVGFPAIDEYPKKGTYVKDIKGRALEVIAVWVQERRGTTMSNATVWIVTTAMGRFVARVGWDNISMDFDKPLGITSMPHKWTPKESAFMKSVMVTGSLVQSYEQIYGKVTPRKRRGMYQRIAAILQHFESKKYMGKIREILDSRGINDEFFVDKMLESIDGPIKNELQYTILKDLARVASPEARQITGVIDTMQPTGLIPMGAEPAQFTDVTKEQELVL